MIIEIASYRGTMVWIDGKQPAKKWSCGEDGQSLTCTGLKIDDLEITKITVGGIETEEGTKDAYYVFGDPIIPQTITIETNKGTFTGPITKIVTGDSIEMTEVEVDLENGEKYMVDEITLFMKATLQGPKNL